MLKWKNITLACSDVAELAIPQELLAQAQPLIKITVAASARELEAQLIDHTPDLIIVLQVHDEMMASYNFLSTIRKNAGFDQVPVYVYTIFPDKKDLCDVHEQWRKLFSYLSL
jgi:DNA-binding NarL/FixJ family response regulator